MKKRTIALFLSIVLMISLTITVTLATENVLYDELMATTHVVDFMALYDVNEAQTLTTAQIENLIDHLEAFDTSNAPAMAANQHRYVELLMALPNAPVECAECGVVGGHAEGCTVAPTPTPEVTATPAPGTTAAPVVTATPVPSTNDPVKFYLKQHIVQAGETMIGICGDNGLDYNLNYNELVKYNPGVYLGWLQIGNKLWLPVNTQPTSGTYYKILEHTIVAGDTMYGLCAANGQIFGNVQDLLTKLNANIYNLYPGNKVLIPVLVQGTVTLPLPGGTTVTPAPATAAPGTTTAPTATPAPGGTGTTTPAPIGATATPIPTATPVPTGDFVKYYMELYTIQPGDTMTGICAAKGIVYEQVADLLTTFNKQFNINFNANYLIANTKIWLPVKNQPATPYYKLIQHKIVLGDTMYGLCDANGIAYWDTIELIRNINFNKDNLIVGLDILLPVYVK